MTPYYHDEAAGISIYHGDCREVLPTLPEGIAGVLATDPPYGYALYETDKGIMPAVYAEWLARFSLCAWFGYPEDLVRLAMQIGRVPDEWITWAPSNRLASQGGGLPKQAECIAIYGNQLEPGNVLRPRALATFGRALALKRGLSPNWARCTDVWTDPKPGASNNHHLAQHPNEKPVSLCKKLLLLLGHSGSAVIDPCCGSGSMLVAAKQLGRCAIGIEIEERYCEVAARRLAQGVLPLTAPEPTPRAEQMAMEVD